MLYKIRNNANIQVDAATGSGVLGYFRTGFMSDASHIKTLAHKPRTLEEMASEIATSTGLDVEKLKVILADEYAILEENGFIISRKTEEELNAKETPLYRYQEN
jgi:hypothetical protein